MEKKYMTLKEVLFGETLSEMYVEMVNNPSVGAQTFCAPGMIHHECTLCAGPADNATLVIKRGGRNKYEFALKSANAESPLAWQWFLEKNEELSELINKLPEHEDGYLETMSYDDSLLIGGIMLNKHGTWPRVLATYQMAFGLARYLMDLILSKGMDNPKNRRRWTWESPSSTIRIKIVELDANYKGEPDSFPQIRIMRYTNDVKHAIHLDLDDRGVISDDISTWMPALQTSILDTLMSLSDAAVVEFITNVTSVAYKSPKDCGFHSSTNRNFTETTMCTAMTQVRMPKYTNTKTPSWIVIPGHLASKWGLPHMDMVGDMRESAFMSDDPVIISPCATWHMPVYNKPEQEIMKICSDCLDSKQ